MLAAAKGKVVVVNVWATFCVPCIEEMPEFVKFYNEREAKEVEFISLNADPPYNLDDAVKPFVAENKLPFPVYLLDEVSPIDLGDLIGAADTNWEGSLPATFVLDKSGVKKKAWFEPVHLSDLKAASTAAQQG